MKVQLFLVAALAVAIQGAEPPASCPHLLHSDQTLIDQRDPVEMEVFLNDLQESLPQLLNHAAWRGDPANNFKLAMRDVNWHLRQNYGNLMHDVGMNIYPLVVMNDADPGELGTGTSVTLYTEDGQIHRYVPTNKHYEIYKDLSHMLFGTFSYVGPYFKSPDSIGWVRPLTEFQSKVQAALYALPTSGLNENTIDRARKMLSYVNDYINEAVAKKSVNIGDFQVLAQKLMPHIDESMRRAVHYQVQALTPLLESIKIKLGSQWDDTYFLIPTVWPVSGINARIQVLETVVSSRRLRTHMITAENVFDHDAARKTLGRVVGDRGLAQIVFGNDSEGMRKHIYALSSPQDLMSDFTDEEIANYLEQNPQQECQ